MVNPPLNIYSPPSSADKGMISISESISSVRINIQNRISHSQQQMFTQFLHPDAVLFGEPINHQIKLRHPYLMKDGEVIVHQIISRVYIPPEKTLKALRAKDKIASRTSSHDYDELYHEDGTFQPDPEDLKVYESPDKVPDESQSSSEEEGEEVKDYNHNPYADQLVGVNVDAGFLPKQINKYLSGKVKKSKSSKVPFTVVSQEKLEQQPQNGWLNDEDDSWVTEQMTEQYLINEQLQEVSGSFATDGAV